MCWVVCIQLEGKARWIPRPMSGYLSSLANAGDSCLNSFFRENCEIVKIIIIRGVKKRLYYFH